MDSGPGMPEPAGPRPLLRLAVALALSALAHAAFIAGVKVEYVAGSAEPPLVIYARLATAEAPPAAEPPAPEPAAPPPPPAPPAPTPESAAKPPEPQRQAAAPPAAEPPPAPQPPPSIQPPGKQRPPAPSAAPPGPAESTARAPAAAEAARSRAAMPAPAAESGAGPALDVPLLSDPTWYGRNEVDVGPKSLGPVEPVFPEEAARQGVQGHVKLMLAIDEAGRVREVDVVEARPEGWFEDAARAAFEQARFSPAQKQGRPVRSRIVVQVRFELGR